MTTYGEAYRNALDNAETSLKEARKADSGGDLWQGRINILDALRALREADTLLLQVSKTAFERVFDEKAKR